MAEPTQPVQNLSEYRTGLCLLLRGVLDVISTAKTPAIDWVSVIEKCGCTGLLKEVQAESVWRWSTQGETSEPVPRPEYLRKRLEGLNHGNSSEIRAVLLELAAITGKKRKRREEEEKRKRRTFADLPTSSLTQLSEKNDHDELQSEKSEGGQRVNTHSAATQPPPPDATMNTPSAPPTVTSKIQTMGPTSSSSPSLNIPFLSPSQSVALTPNSALALVTVAPHLTETKGTPSTLGKFLSSEEEACPPQSMETPKSNLPSDDAGTPLSSAPTQVSDVTIQLQSQTQ